MNKEINDGIIALHYDSNTVLAFNGNTVENLVPTEDMFKDGKYIVVTHTKHSASQQNFDIAVVTGIIDHTYPGALVIADEDLVNNTPSLLAAKRAGIKMFVNLPNIGDAGSLAIESPSYSSISTAIDKATSAWLANNVNYNTPAMCTYDETKVYSNDQLRVAMGFDLGTKLKIDFTAVNKNEKQIFVVAFKQVFYTVSVDTPECPAMFFADDEQWQNLLNNGVSDNTPPAYVANVSYGRSIFVTIETSNMSTEIEAKIQAAIRNAQIDASVFSEKAFENCEYSAVMIGGNPEDIALVSSGNINDIAKAINNGCVYSSKNPGAPIAYTSVFMKGNEIAKINSSTEYVETTSTEYSSGSINLSHKGGYIAKFYVNWKELSYDSAGNKKYKECSWGKNGDNLTAPFSTTIPLPANAVNIHVKATEKTGLVWEPWRTVVDQDVVLSPSINVSISGTTLSPKKSVEYK